MKLPIKIKIFIGLTVILIGVIGVNLYFSSQLFVKDKTNYVYENGLQRLEDLSYQLQTPVAQAFGSLKPYILLAEENPEQFKTIFNSNSSISYFAYQTEQEKWKTFDKKENGVLSSWFQSQLPKIKFSDKLQISQFKKKQVDYIYLTLKTEKLKILAVLNFNDFFEVIRSTGNFKYYLLKGNGKSFISKRSRPQPHHKVILSAQSTRGTKKVNAPQGETLVSYVKIPDLNLILIAEITTKQAFQVAEELVLRTFFIGMIILGLSIIISLIFSSKLTKPIRILHDATIHFAQGNYDEKVNINTSDELKDLGESFNDMGTQIGNLLEEQKKMILQLEDYNQNLEQKVEERTKELQDANNFIQAMINSLNQGLLVFDQDLNIAPTFTKSCETIFDTQIKDSTYNKVLDLTEKESDLLKKSASLTFSGKLPFASASGLITKNKIYGTDLSDENYKHVALEYFPLKNSEEELTHIVAVATDKTDEIRAIEAFKQKEAYVEMITKLVGNKKQFLNFMSDIESSLKIVAHELDGDEPNYDLMLMQYHTINGGAGTYSALELQAQARASEQTIIDAKEKGEYPMDVIFNDFSLVNTKFKELKDSIDLVLGSNVNTIEIDRDVIASVLAKFKGVISTEDYMYLEDNLFNESVLSYLSEYIELVNTIAEKTGKYVHPLAIQGGDTKVPPEKLDRFFNSLVHLFRNCVDHGIESPDKRSQNGKEEYGKIDIAINKNGQELSMVVKDDGGGINPEKIRSKWEEMHPGDSSINELSDEDVIYKIFDPTFSTTDQLTEFSGRGVGMSAIKETVEEMGGKVAVQSQVDVGTTFTFNIPLN